MSIVKATAKPRWKGALLAAATAGVFAPAAAHATLTISMSFGATNPFGSSTAYYVSPDQAGLDIPVYVYATVTGSSAPTPATAGTSATPPVTTGGNFDGLQYLYYNVVNNGSHEVSGGVDATNTPVLNATLGFNGTGVQPNPASATGVGAQVGTVVNSAPTGTTAGLSVGSFANLATATTTAAITAAMEAIPKPRANSPVFNNYASAATSSGGGTVYTSYANDGTNIIVSGNSTTFLVETLYYKPTTGSFTASSLGTPIETTLSAAIPALPAAINIATANFYQDVATQNSGTSQATSTSGISTGTGATLINALPGDATRDGSVTFADLSTVLSHYNLTDSLWKDGNFSNGTDPKVDFSDLSQVLSHYNQTLNGTAPVDVPVDAAVLADPAAVAALEAAGFVPVAAVPEPATMTMLASVGLLVAGRRRRTSK